eukprot:scaffold21812_cov110-Isochrysis_galbana.AAC.14
MQGLVRPLLPRAPSPPPLPARAPPQVSPWRASRWCPRGPTARRRRARSGSESGARARGGGGGGGTLRTA